MSLKALADAVLERNHTRNHHATEDKNTVQLGGVKTPSEVAQGDPAIRAACRSLAITPDQFLALTTEEDRACIERGDLPPINLRAYAASYAEGIRSRRIAFHPTTGRLLRHN